jgi:hypothetical protein
MILSSLLSSRDLLSSRGLVKISASCSLVLTCEITMSPLMAWSLQKWCRIVKRKQKPIKKKVQLPRLRTILLDCDTDEF